MAGKIFINYRREDSRDAAARVYGALAPAFAANALFMDVDNLLAGQRFDKELEQALAECDVFLAVIGPDWLKHLEDREDSGERDYVREEIAGALKRHILVIPVLVNGAQLPRGQELPDDISDLVKHQKHDLRHEHFGRDMAPLIDAIRVQRGSLVSRKPWRVLGIIGSAIIAAAVAGALVWQYAGIINSPPVPSGPAPQIEAPKPDTSAADEAAPQRAKAEEDAAAAKRKADEQVAADAKLKAEDDRKRAEVEAAAKAEENKRLNEKAAADAEAQRLADEKAKADAEAPLAKLKTDATEKAKADVAAKVELPKSPDSKARSATPVQPTPANTITKKASAAPPGTNSNVTGSAPNKTASSSISVNQANCRGAYDRAAVASMNYNNNHPGSESYRLKYERLYTFGKQCEQAGYTNLRLGASYGTNR